MTGIDEESKNEVFGHLLAIELMLNMLVTRVCLDRGPYAIELADVFRGDMRKNLDAIKTPEDPTKAASVKQAPRRWRCLA